MLNSERLKSHFTVQGLWQSSRPPTATRKVTCAGKMTEAKEDKDGDEKAKEKKEETEAKEEAARVESCSSNRK